MCFGTCAWKTKDTQMFLICQRSGWHLQIRGKGRGSPNVITNNSQIVKTNCWWSWGKVWPLPKPLESILLWQFHSVVVKMAVTLSDRQFIPKASLLAFIINDWRQEKPIASWVMMNSSLTRASKATHSFFDLSAFPFLSFWSLTSFTITEIYKKSQYLQSKYNTTISKLTRTRAE